jgi:hypothetical protein
VTVPFGDGHILSFDGQSHRGEFSHSRWTADDIANLMVTAHETPRGTELGYRLGALLQATAIAAQLLPAEPQYAETLTELVRRCRRTHEAYATHCSLVGILNADEDSVPTDRGVLVSVAVSGCRDEAWHDL